MLAEQTIETISIDALRSIGEPLLEGLARKYVIGAGRGETVTERSHVVLELRMMIKGRTALEYPEESPFVQCVDRVLPPGLRVALLSMKKGERALVWTDAILGFGNYPILLESSGKRIRRKSDLVFEIFLKSWSKPDVATNLLHMYKLTPECVPLINQYVELANSMMRKGNNIRALAILRGCLYKARRIRINGETEPKEERVREDLMFELTLRAAECAFQLARYPLAVSFSREALSAQPFNAYANYLCGCAYFSLGALSCASHFLRVAHHNDISNSVYKEKVFRLENHQSILERDVTDESDDTDGSEEYARNCIRKILAHEKALKKDVQTYINMQLELGVRSVSIGGGFRPLFLTEVAEKITSRNKEVQVDVRDDCLDLHF